MTYLAIYILIGLVIFTTFIGLISISPLKDHFVHDLYEEIQQAGLATSLFAMALLILSWPLVIALLIREQI